MPTILRRLTHLSAAALSLAAATAFAETPQWIWSATEAKPDQTVYFRKTFTVQQSDTVRLQATGDDEVTVLINGKPVLTGDGWDKIQVKEVSGVVAKGPNVIAVKGTNRGGNKGAVLVKLIIETRNKGAQEIVTDATWKASETASPGWEQVKFDDKAWQPAISIAPIGGGPWAKVTEKTLAAAANLKEPEATAIKDIKLKEGFKAELLYSVPLKTQGSWVANTFDDKGRLIVSDQYGKLYRVTPPALGGKPADTKVEEIPAEIGEAQGLLFAFGHLYAITNSDKFPRGLYRISDTNNDDMFDKVEQLRAFTNKGGEHGPHAVVLGPDGKSIYCVVGNQTPITEMNTSRVPQHWAEDVLLPPLIGRGFMRDVMATGGWIAKTDPDGKTWELITTGFRNEYDAAFNREGDLFTYDADMEWDFSVPWYRPTRICMAQSGGEYGWRSLSKKWPVRWEDSLPPVTDIGPGSPTGVTFGYGAKFPAKYQETLFSADWSYGKLYAVHLKPQGAGYTAEFEEFMSANPLPLTDLAVSPKDGALYITIGGRRVQSGLYRVTYVGKESTTPQPFKLEGEEKKLHELRRSLEAFHGKQDPKALDAAWPNLDHTDRHIRFAARIAVEHQPVATWKARALAETSPRASLQALMALSRAGQGDKALLAPIIESLSRIFFADLKGLDRETYV
ncbi:MAG: heme-binding protein, partial [Verrucomicrobium sp.]